jgi:DNA-binding MarR family transcriptional regulator
MSRLHAVFHHIDFVILNILEGITQASQFRIDIMESDVLLMSTVFLLILACVATVLYYRRIKGARAKYEEARDVVGDVVVSFSKQLQRHEEQLEKANYRVEGLSARSENVVLKVEELGKQTSDLALKVANTSEVQYRLTKDIEDMKAGLNDMRKAQEDIIKQVSETSEAKVEAAIPIKREHALAPLTETELRVLEFIAEGGEKTAPEIRDLTGLTREHSARLVKKLYEEGYLERDTGKTPFRYHVKDEMLKILKKSEVKA